ncbi:DEAD/DEAH box helicase [Streptomyces sp. NPDC001351]|uniref:DEAD/DEAH box helicase n=1 Tax=Streptomyces sp. NPDC001351 TaxID=3364564 RepID=UPI0036C1268D
MGRPEVPGQLQATFVPDAEVPGKGRMAFWGTPDPVAHAAALGLRVPLAGPGAGLPVVLPAGDLLVGAEVPALLVPLGEALAALAGLPSADPSSGGPRLGASVHAWAVAAKLALEHVVAGHLTPVLSPGKEGHAYAHWRADRGGDPRLAALAEVLPAAAHALRIPADGTGTQDGAEDVRVCAPHELLGAFCDAVADFCARAAADDGAPGARPHATAAVRTGDWPDAWLEALTGGAESAVVTASGAPPAERLTAWAGSAAGEHVPVRLCLRLGLPAGPDAPWPLTFHLQTVDEPALLVPAQRVWTTQSATLTLGSGVLDRPQDVLAEGLALAARTFRPVAGALSLSHPVQAMLTPYETAELLGDGGTALRTAGIEVLVPDGLDEPGNVLGPRLRVGSRRGGRPADRKNTKKTGPHGRTVTYRWEAVVGDETLTSDEVAALAERGEPLAPWRDRWVRLDCTRIDELAALVGSSGRLSMAEALSVVLCGRHHTEEFGEVPALADGSVAELVTALRELGNGGEPELTGVRAELRDYQRRGVAWLQSLTGLGFGALLADDMGLGKTLQTIALIASRTGELPNLVVCPTSVMSNWERELARFAPGLSVRRHHGPRRAVSADDFQPGDVVVTSYALLRLDAELLTSLDWNLVVLDEAQQIKNHAAQTARAAARLAARQRVALTGTPVENRLSELWSIMNFTNPGLLGSHRRFKERFADPIEREGETEAAERLRAVIGPFVLRRLKSAVVDELPPKLESTVACNLTAEQATLYRSAVAAAFDTDGGLGTGLRRHGNVLRLLTELKQICNHPVQYLRRGEQTGEERLAGRSGKLARATEMLSEAVAAGDRVLVFTQYRVMGELLSRHLVAELGLDHVPFLHGGTRVEERDRMVEAFQHDETASPVLVISLKAGGFGLNLTRAAHVLHYDRWWNPAVEQQATDRAHRLGQTRTVHVHKLVTADTFEERIDALLESKRSLADAVVGTSETWLSELDDAALRDLVQLADSGVDE